MIFSDPCGLLSVFFIYLCYPFFTYLGLFKGIFLYYLAPEVFASIYIVLVGLSVMCHLMAMISDPGYAGSFIQPLLSEESVCQICQITRSPRTHHCKRCKKCVQNMDHHCQWINNCVGFKNQKHFILFLVYTLVLIIWYCFIVISRFLFCGETCDKNMLDEFIIFVSFLWAIFFALLCGLTLKNQVKTVIYNISEIDVLQKRSFEKRPLKENLEEVFGGPFNLSWFLPIPVKAILKPIIINED